MKIEEESNPTVLKTLKSFIPDKLGYTQQITYNQHSTSTGRLTVDKGPQILTLAKKYRDIIQSRFEGGQGFGRIGTQGDQGRYCKGRG